MSFSRKTQQIINQIKESDYGTFQPAPTKKGNCHEKCLSKTNKNCQSNIQLKIGSTTVRKNNSKDQLLLQMPIVIQRKNQQNCRSFSANKMLTQRKISSVKKVQPFVPISIARRDRNHFKLETTTMETTVNKNKQIEIIIEGEDKECLKKLFKKIHALTEDLALSEKQRIRLQLQFDHLSRRDINCKDHEKSINKLEGENYKLQMENQILKKSLKEQNQNHKEVIKEFVVEKPIEVKVEVPKYIPGPERIIEKIVEVPKYVEVQKRVPYEVIKEVKITVPQIIQKPVYIDRPVNNPPVYIDKPIYIDRPIEIQKKVQVPYEVQIPIYIDRPIVDEDWYRKLSNLEDQLGELMKENQALKSQNHTLKISLVKNQNNIDVLRMHNEEKNREVQNLLNNRSDYMPIIEKMPTRKYSMVDHTQTRSSLSPRSQNNHFRYF